MTIPRKQQICLETTRYYHCTTRCVRRGFLCGFDHATSTDYEHRKAWLERRLQHVASVYCIKLCSYAVMENHYHTVVYIDKEQALNLSDREVIERWNVLHHLPVLVKKSLGEVELTKTELESVKCTVDVWRKRLFGLDWFMKEVNLYMAKRANEEDKCTGHFWESRFKCQSLVDEKALLSAMVYDELNPVRSKSAKTPEQSHYISLSERIKELKNNGQKLPCMHPFIDSVDNADAAHVPYSLLDYIELVDWTGRQLRADKRGHIDEHLPPILHRIGITGKHWLEITTQLGRPRSIMVGTKQMIKFIAKRRGYTRVSGFALPD